MAENTFFGEIHKELDAKMVPCGKWNMPLFYPGGSVAEHRHCCSGAAVFDRSMVRCFQISGEKCAALLDGRFLRPVSDMPVGSCKENCLLHGDGTVSVVFTLCRMQEDDFMLLGQSGTPDKEFDHLLQVISGTLAIRELSEAMAQLAVSGRKSAEILQQAGAETLPEKGFWQSVTLKDDEGDEFRCIVIHGERAGMDNFHLCFNARYALEVYGAVYSIPGVAPAGLGAWKSLRIESGEAAAPDEIRSDFFPAECGLENWVDMNREFTGKAALGRSEVRFILHRIKLERHPAQPGAVVKLPGGVAAGVVTSSAFCPVAGCALAICRMDKESGVRTGDTVICPVNDREVSCTIL